MKRKMFMALIFGGLLCTAFAAQGSAKTGARELLLLYSNNVLGETEPCG